MLKFHGFMQPIKYGKCVPIDVFVFLKKHKKEMTNRWRAENRKQLGLFKTMSHLTFSQTTVVLATDVIMHALWHLNYICFIHIRLGIYKNKHFTHYFYSRRLHSAERCTLSNLHSHIIFNNTHRLKPITMCIRHVVNVGSY